MIVYYQKDERWAKEKLGHTNLTIGGYGCLLTCISMLDGRCPKELNQIFIKIFKTFNRVIINLPQHYPQHTEQKWWVFRVPALCRSYPYECWHHIYGERVSSRRYFH